MKSRCKFALPGSPALDQPGMFPSGSFTGHLLRLNALEGNFCRWLLLTGMRFGDTAAWWKPGRRQTSHEGVDLLYYINERGARRQLPEEALVPGPGAGTVAACFEDFLGRTVMVRHDIVNPSAFVLHSLLAHTRPLVAAGAKVAPGQALAALAQGGRSSTAPPGHLHLSLAWLHPQFPVSGCTWPLLIESPLVHWVDPGDLL